MNVGEVWEWWDEDIARFIDIEPQIYLVLEVSPAKTILLNLETADVESFRLIVESMWRQLF
jgi:hypothetical protein